MADLRLKLLGGFELRSASGAPIPFAAKKPALLLAYLALRPGRPLGRDKLAGLFWGDSGEAQARASLRQAIAVLRRLLGSHQGLIVTPDSETIVLERGGLLTDVAEFERCLASGARDALEQAVALYEGDFLDGFKARESLLEEWLVTERRRLREQILAAMAALLPETEEAGPPEAGIGLALRILALDPLQEAAHRALMRLYARQGRRGAALTQYQTLRATLARELGVAPEEETQRLYKELRDQRGKVVEQSASRLPPEPGAPPAEARVAGGVGTGLAHLGEPQFETIERPVVAVLPFTNMSDTDDQEYFADGLTDDLITALSAWRWFPVIARHSTFAYKGRSPTITQVAKELAVRYVVEGSVRRAGNRVRIAAQLIDATTGHHIWAQRYDRELTDIFAVQDEITERMVTAIEPELDRAERRRAARKSPDNLDAWDLALRAQSHVYQFTAEDNREAFRLLEQCNPARSRLVLRTIAPGPLPLQGRDFGLQRRSRKLVCRDVSSGRASGDAGRRQLARARGARDRAPVDAARFRPGARRGSAWRRAQSKLELRADVRELHTRIRGPTRRCDPGTQRGDPVRPLLAAGLVRLRRSRDIASACRHNGAGSCGRREGDLHQPAERPRPAAAHGGSRPSREDCRGAGCARDPPASTARLLARIHR